jgi:hypothetical protein
MTAELAITEPRREFDDLFWEGLLLQIEEHRVIPILGPDLLTVEDDGRPVLLYRWAAERLAVRLRVSPEELPPGYGLNEVVCRYLRDRGDLNDVYIGLATVMREKAFSPPPPLRHLAAITDFNLFVTTTFDSLLVEAIRAERPGISPDVIAYSPGKVLDLPLEKDRLERPTVYHLFGRVAPAASYAVSDEDLLEFVSRLQSVNYEPEKLCAELQANHLLILGCSYSDWLERFFLRTTKHLKLSESRGVGEVLADRSTRTDPRLVLFLEHFSRSTKVFHGGDADQFVAELWRRWTERRAPARSGTIGTTHRVTPVETPMTDGAIFISYTRKDLDAAKRLKAGLDAAGLPVWFDMSDVEPGDDFARTIEGNVERCGVFVPVISANTEARREAFFYREWKWALRREQGMAVDRRFIVPIVIDETREPGIRVPKRFAELQWTRLPRGEVTPAFVAIVGKLRENR